MLVTTRETGESKHHASLRPLVAAIGREMSRLAGGTLLEPGRDLGALLEAWAELVELLALGAAPEMRQCPVCKHEGMAAAARCGFCWSTLSPLLHGQLRHLQSSHVASAAGS